MNKGELLIHEFLENSEDFNKNQKAYELLQEYFSGLSIDTLKPLLKSKNASIQGPAVWIASELGEQNCNLLLDYVIPLLNHDLENIRYYAMECTLLGTLQNNKEKFAHLALLLEDSSEYIRMSAMRLVSKASTEQIQASLKKTRGLNSLILTGLKKLQTYNTLTREEIEKMTYDDCAVTRRFASIIARKKYRKYPAILEHLTTSKDGDIQWFAKVEIGILA